MTRTLRISILILAIAGIVVSALALQAHYSTKELPCTVNDRWDCGIVNKSEYAVIRGLPVAALGIAGYLALGLLAVWGRRLLVLFAALAFAFGAYLTGIEVHVLAVYCLYCVTSFVISGLILLLSVMLIGPEPQQRGQWWRSP